MTRRTREVHIDSENSRDHGKTFVITEMPSEDAEWWAFRVLQGIAAADVEIDLNAPLAELAAVGFRGIAQISPEKARPIITEMMDCVKVKMPDGNTRNLLPSDIEEVATRVKLRMEVFDLHTGFFSGGGA